MKGKFRLAIWGSNGHARVVADIFRQSTVFDLIGFLDDFRPKQHGDAFLGLPLLGGAADLASLSDVAVTHIAFGFGDPHGRLRLGEVVESRGFLLATAIHPSAIVANDVAIGTGCVIVAGAILNPGTKLGKNVIVNTAASIDHGCTIEDGAHICPGVRLAGDVRVGRGSWIGIGSTVIQKVRIGAGTTIGAGSLVLRDIPDGVVAYGTPARIVRKASEYV